MGSVPCEKFKLDIISVTASHHYSLSSALLYIHRLLGRGKSLHQIQPIYSLNFSTEGAIVQELRESRGGRPGLSVLMSLMVSVDIKLY